MAFYFVSTFAIAQTPTKQPALRLSRTINARSIGTETLLLHAAQQLQLDEKLSALGFNKRDVAAALGSIIGRAVSPGSELQTHDWLQNRTGLGELLGHDFDNISLTRLYTVSNKLLKHSAALESFLSAREQSLGIDGFYMMNVD
jgi:hypothetical protein